MTIARVHRQDVGPSGRASSLLGDAQQPLLVVDPEGTVLESTRTANMLLGRQATSLLGLKCFELMNGRTTDASFSCSPACPWLVMARTGGPAGPTDVTILPGARTKANARFRLTHVPLLGIEEPVLIHLLEDVGQESLQARVGARLDSLQLGNGRAVGPLTAREVAVLRLIARGLTSAQIAAQLAVKPTTVRTHTARIFGKLGARSRTDALILFLTGDFEAHR